jgi:hypothetical protein
MVAFYVQSADRADVIRLPVACRDKAMQEAFHGLVGPMINLEPNGPERGEGTAAAHCKSITEEDRR